MRRILIEQARRKNTFKAGGEFHRVELSDVDPAIGGPSLDILALNEALDKLEAKDARKAQLVKLRFFTGLTIEQAAEALNLATSTAEADWAYASRAGLALPRIRSCALSGRASPALRGSFEEFGIDEEQASGRRMFASAPVDRIVAGGHVTRKR